jgi:hypothetical protein
MIFALYGLLKFQLVSWSTHRRLDYLWPCEYQQHLGMASPNLDSNRPGSPSDHLHLPPSRITPLAYLQGSR